MTLSVQGYCDERFAGVKTVFETLLFDGTDLGASF